MLMSEDTTSLHAMPNKSAVSDDAVNRFQSASETLLGDFTGAPQWTRTISDAPWTNQTWSGEDTVRYIKAEIAKNRELFQSPLDLKTPISRSPLAGDGCRLTFRDASFSITLPDKTKKMILEPVSGHFEPGQLVAIMGPSGCGKSTLLDMLANKKTAGYEGDIYVNGHPRDHLFQRIAAYVGQEDVMPQFWTVQEAILFNSALKAHRNKYDIPAEIVQGRLEAVMEAFGLASVKDTYLGGLKVRGCSGGQRRRVTLARGVTQNAQLLFLDEPTSGLSATDAQLCVKSLRIIAQRFNLLVLVVIHQPRVEVAELFDQFILLTSNPGRMIYNGHMNQALQYWHECGHTVPQHANPTDFYLDLVTPGSPTDHTNEFVAHFAQKQKPGVDNVVSSRMAEKGKTARQMLEDTRDRMQMTGMDMSSIRFRPHAASPKVQFFVLLRRKVALTKRDRSKIIMPLVVPCAQGVLMGLMFQGIGSKDLQFQIGFFFLLLTMLCMKGMQNLPSLIEERTIMKYETSEMLYSEFAFILCSFCIDIPLSILGSVLQVTIMYTFSGIDWKYYGPTLAWALFVFFVFDSIFGFIGGLAADSQSAQILAIPFNSIFMLFSGFMVTRSSAPSYLKWLFEISPMGYAIQSIVIMLADDETQPASNCPIPPGFTTPRPLPTVGEAVITQYGFERGKDEQGIFILLAMVVVFRAGQIWALKAKNNIQK